MPFFPCAHAGHSVWEHAVKQVIVQLNAQINMQKLEGVSCLGMVYISVSYADHAGEVMAALSQALPQVKNWVGCAGHSVLAGDMDYGQTGAVAVMLSYLPEDHYQVFSGISPRLDAAFSSKRALVHGDATAGYAQQQLDSLVTKLKCSNVVGGISALSNKHVQWAWGEGRVGNMPASIGGGGVQVGGLSGVVFAQDVDCLAISMQACKPQGSSYIITKTDGDVVLELNGRHALEVVFGSVHWDDVFSQGRAGGEAVWERVHQTLFAIAPADSDVHSACIAPQARVVRVAGIDAQRQGIVLSGKAHEGCVLTLCAHDEHAARTDMRRACAQVWDALTCDVAPAAGGNSVPCSARSISGAIYIRNQARQSLPRIPQVDAELQLIRHALGPVPLLGFTSTFEVDGADLQHLSAQLLVFTQPLQAFS